MEKEGENKCQRWSLRNVKNEQHEEFLRAKGKKGWKISFIESRERAHIMQSNSIIREEINEYGIFVCLGYFSSL